MFLSLQHKNTVMSLPSGENKSGFVENCSIPSTVGLYKELAWNVLVLQVQSRGFSFLFCTFASGLLGYQGPY